MQLKIWAGVAAQAAQGSLGEEHQNDGGDKEGQPHSHTGEEVDLDDKGA